MSSLAKWLAGLVIAALIGLIATTSVYVHDTTEAIVVTRWGNPVRIDPDPGLRIRWPLGIERVNRISNRIHLLIPPEAEYLTEDKRNLNVSSFMLWRVSDPLLFIQSVGDRSGAEARLSFVLSSELGTVLANAEFAEILVTDETSDALSQLNADLLERCRAIALEQYGVEVVDVRIRRLSFPELNRIAVFERMRAERKRIAVKVRSEGEEEATKIRSSAELEKAQILSEAEREAEEILGRGEADAARIYADAIREDPQFYEFLRTLEAYDKILDEETTMVLPADAELLELLLEGPGG